MDRLTINLTICEQIYEKMHLFQEVRESELLIL